MVAETWKLVFIWLHCLHALLCIPFIADLIPILHLSGFCRRFCRAARQICFNQSEALPRSGQWHVISMEFLHPFFRRQFAGKIIVFIFSVNPCRKQSWISPKSLKLPLQFVAHSFHQVWINQMFSLVNLGSVMLFLPLIACFLPSKLDSSSNNGPSRPSHVCSIFDNHQLAKI